MQFLDKKWAILGTNKRNDTKRRNEMSSQRRFLINSSDNESEDEEWIQQLERDYGKQQQKRTKWTRLEKVLIAALFSCALLISILISALLYSRYKHGETLLEFTLGGQRFCNEKGCVDASHRALAYIDDTVDPCVSFYDYACGSWLKNTDIPSTHTKWTSFSQVSDNNQRTLKHILDRLKLDEENSIALSKVHRYYRACLRKDFIEINSNSSLIDLINYIESWAVTNKSSWNEEQWNFGQALTRIHHLKSMPLFYMYVAADDRNSSSNVIQIEQSGISLGDESIYRRPENDKILKAYKKLMITVGLLLGAEEDSTVKQMNEIFEFEKKLAYIYESKSKIRETDQIYHKMTVAELQTLCPAIPWLDYMNSMFREPVKADEPVVVYTPNYLKNMSDLVIKTERRIIANYMVWHLIKPVLVLLSKPYRTAALELSSKESGLRGIEDSWKNCVTKTDSVMGFATGHLFVKEMEKQGIYPKKEVGRMLEMIKEAFILNLHSVPWMDDLTKIRAAEKASSIINMVGYPDWTKSTANLDKYYENITITDNPLRNYLNAREFYHEKTMQRRGRPVQRDEWHMTPTEVNAYYNSPNNYIAFPAGILQSPFYNPMFPDAMNYGALGTVMGHELTHGFDTQGRHFDKKGNLMKWWTNESTIGFLNQSKCMEKQYEAFGSQKDGKKSLSENIADNGGIKIAYTAFKTNEYVHGVGKSLPGLKLFPNQLFFIGFAQTWCSIETPEKAIQSAITDSHSTEKTRVDVSLSNSKDFATAFKCSLGKSSVEDLVKFLRTTWPSSSITPKLHMLEDHVT